MKINVTDNTISKSVQPVQNKNISCKSAIQVSPLKNIKGNHCACCGHEMITSAQMAKLWAKITRPISEVFNDGLFEKIKEYYPGIYDVLCYFNEKKPNKSLDSILIDKGCHSRFIHSIENSFKGDAEFENVPRAIRHRAVKGRTMSVIKCSDNVLLNAGEVIKHLMPYREYMYDYRGDILDELQKLAEQYPDKKLSEIIKIQEIADNNVEKTYYTAMEFAEKRDLHWDKAEELILAERPDLSKDLNKIRTQVCLLYRDEIDPKRLSYNILKLYQQLLDKNDLQHLSEDVRGELSQMPVELFNKYSFLAYARRFFSDGAIVNYIIKPFMESIDHIVSVVRTKDVKEDDVLWKRYNAIVNNSVMCRMCNYMKGSLSFSEVSEYRPEIVENTKKQIDFYADKIIDGTVPIEYAYYPPELSSWLTFDTDGKFVHDVSDYVKKLEEMDVPLRYFNRIINSGSKS